MHPFGQMQRFALLRTVHFTQGVHPRPRRIDDFTRMQRIRRWLIPLSSRHLRQLIHNPHANERAVLHDQFLNFSVIHRHRAELHRFFHNFNR
ncbi:hypothetical protein D3C85_1427170 [compost metagenome]